MYRCGRCASGLAGLGGDYTRYLTSIFGKDSPIVNAVAPALRPAATTVLTQPATDPRQEWHATRPDIYTSPPYQPPTVAPDVPSPATGGPSVVRAGSSLGPWPFVVAGVAFVLLAKARR